MANKGFASQNTQLKRGDGASPEAFSAIAEVTDIDGPSFKLDVIEVTHLLNVWKEFRGTYMDPGVLKGSANLIPTDASQQAILADAVARAVRNYQIVWPDGVSTTWRFAGLLTTFNAKAPAGGKVSLDWEVKLTGVPAFT